MHVTAKVKQSLYVKVFMEKNLVAILPYVGIRVVATIQINVTNLLFFHWVTIINLYLSHHRVVIYTVVQITVQHLVGTICIFQMDVTIIPVLIANRITDTKITTIHLTVHIHGNFSQVTSKANSLKWNNIRFGRYSLHD